MFTFEVDEKPLTIMVANDMREFAQDIRSFHEPLKLAVQGIIAPSIRQNFEVGGRPAWDSLADTTLARKKQNKNTILVETGKLKRVAGQLNAWTITRDSATFDKLPGVEYGNFHQTGTTNMAAREFAVIQADDEIEVEMVFESWLRRRAQARNFR